jgi:long-chain fatty acid transport protein
MKPSETRLNRITKILLFFVIGLVPGLVLSSGFQLTPTTSGISRLLGGNGIIGDDPGDMFYNPAGLSLQQTNAFQGDLYYIKVENSFIDQGSTQSVLTPTGPLTFPLGGGTNNSSSDSAVVPILFIVNKLQNGLTFGLGVTTPLGLSTTYDNNWIGRYHTTRAELNAIDINPAISKQVNDQFIIAAGISVQYVNVELSQAVPTPTPGLDAMVKVEGDDVNLGFNLGSIYSPDEDTRIGLAYRSKISHTLSGDSTQSVMGMPIGIIGAPAPFTTPESLNLSFYRSLKGSLEKWSVGAGIRWTDWSRFKEIRIDFADGSSDISPQNWESAFTYGISTDYQANDRTRLIFSLGYDESAVPDAASRPPQIPDTDKTLVGFGVDRDYAWGESDYTLGFGWQRAFLGSRDINRTRPLSTAFSTTLTGQYDENHFDVFSIKLIKKWNGS